MKRALIGGAALIVVLGIGILATIFHKTNTPPTASEGSIRTEEDPPAAISLKGSDPDGNLLSYSIVTKPAHGTLSGTEPNLIYSPELNFNGVDGFTFKVSDGASESKPTAFSIMVTPINDPPLASDDNVEVQEDSPLIDINVLENDTDVDGDQLTILGATEGSHGSTVITSDNKRITYTPNRNFSGADSFTYNISDNAGGTDTATVYIKITTVNDPPSIRSKPVTTTRVWGTYNYDVEATDPDPGDNLTYSLIKKPEGMSINSSTGMIEWKPTGSQAGTYEVQVKVEDAADTPASDTQEFSVTVASLDSPLTFTMTVKNGYDSQNSKILSEENSVKNIQASDNNYNEIPGNSFISYVFTGESIPAGATIASVVLYIEHFENTAFPSDKLQWNIGTGWPNNADIWDSINAPTHEGQAKKAADSWDITSFINSPEKLNSLQLQIKNGNTQSSQKTSIDYIYAVVKWY